MAKKLIDILSDAAVVRDETNEKANTAERVGGVLVELANYLAHYLYAEDISIKADATSVKVRFALSTSEGVKYYKEIALPVVGDTAGVIAAEDFAHIISELTRLSDRIMTESEARETADTELSERLTAETSARTQRDTELTSALNAETNTRLTADSEEKEARKAADSELSDRISAEEEARTQRDEELTEQLLDELQNRVAADASEAAARESADEELTTRISAEESLRAERDEKLRMMCLVTVRNIERLILLLSPTSMTVEAPKSITITNPERQRIVAKVNGYGQAMPDTYFLDAEWKDVDYVSTFRNLANVIFQSDNRAVFVMTDGTIVPLAVGRSLVNIVPTRNTDLAQTVTIDVHEPYLSKVSASSLKLTGSGALRFI